MKRSTFIRLGLGCFALVIATFIVRGLTRLVLGDRVSAVLSLPFGLVALGLLLALTAIALMDVIGVRRLEDDLDGR